jgi:hypothetical protein
MAGLLVAYVAETTIPGSAELIMRIQQRVAVEPQTPPRRLVAAIAGLRLRDAVSAFRQTLVVAAGGRDVRVAMQAQAIVVLLVAITILGAAGAGAGLGIGSWLWGSQAGLLPPIPGGAASAVPTAEATPSSSPDLASTPPRSRPSASPRARSGSETGIPDPTDRRRIVDRPEPDPTAKSTPRRTRRPTRTHHPVATERPRRTKAPDDEDGDVETDDGHDGHGGEGGHDAGDRSGEPDEDD